MRVERRRDGGGKALTVDGQGGAGRHLVGVGHAHDERAQPAHLLMQQADGVEFLVVGAERVGANQFGKRGGLVGRRHAQRAHLVKHHGKRARGDLPSCLRSGKSAADHVHRLKMRLRHGQKLFLSRAGDNAEAARRWRRVPRFWIAGLRAFLPPSGFACPNPNEHLQ